MLSAMKTAIFLALLCPLPALASFEVHEWGTFTTLSASNGRVLEWYLPHSDASALPGFVEKRGFITKFALARMRMETPVIYFYPDQAQTVTVEAKLEKGTISEVYPHTDSVDLFDSGPPRWTGELRPPGDAESSALIPTVSADEAGSHYAAARAVPQAWNFHHRGTDSPGATRSIPAQAERFIFYRGSGEAVMPLSLTVRSGGEIRLHPGDGEPAPIGLALEVRDGLASWQPLPSGEAGQEISIRLEAPTRPVAEVESQLADWFGQVLREQGLSGDEADAMVATWHGQWFREPGLRAFTLVPRKWVDQAVPLNIEPRPDRLVRVFVARHELLVPEREQALTRLLMDESTPVLEARAALDELGFGRFADGAKARALELAQVRMARRFHELASSTEQASR